MARAMHIFHTVVETVIPPFWRNANTDCCEDDLRSAMRIYGKATVVRWLDQGMTPAEILKAAKSQGAAV